MAGINFEGVIEWPFVDAGSRRDKTLDAIDVIADAPVGLTMSVGWNQRNRSERTTEHAISADTLDGTPVPLPITAPTFSLRLTFAANQQWEFQAAHLYTVD